MMKKQGLVYITPERCGTDC